MAEKVSLEDLRQIVRDLSRTQRELAEQVSEAQQRLAEQISESQQRMAEQVSEAQQRMAEQISEAQQRTEEAQQRTEEAQQRTEEAQQRLGEKLEITQKIVKEQSKSLKRASGNFTSKWGRFLEGFVKGTLVALLQKRGIEVSRLQRRMNIPSEVPGESAGDFDLVALNGKEIVVVEVKTTLTTPKLEKFLAHLKKFKTYFSEYDDRVIYGGVAYMDTAENDEEVGERAMEEGLFAIVAPGGDAKVAKVINPADFTPKKF